MSVKRRKYSPGEKAKIVLEAIKIESLLPRECVFENYILPGLVIIAAILRETFLNKY